MAEYITPYLLIEETDDIYLKYIQNLSSTRRGNELARYPSDTTLREISESLRYDWMKLGIYLSVRKEDRLAIEDKKTPYVMALEMLNIWWEQNPSLQELQEALKSHHRNDLVQYSKDFFKLYNIQPFNISETKIQIYFSKIAENIPREWKSIGLQLDISFNTIHMIQANRVDRNRNYAYEVLQIWKKKQTSPPIELIKVLKDDMNRCDVLKLLKLRMSEGCY